MITGISLPALAAQIKKEKAEKRDFIAPTTKLRFVPMKESQRGVIAFSPDENQVLTEPTDHCLAQICQRSGIPKPYADRMRGDNLELLATNVNVPSLVSSRFICASRYPEFAVNALLSKAPSGP